MAHNAELVEREGADITANDMLIPEETPSEIRKFYNGATIFLTGGSGFLGSLLIEKILRACPNINKIYLLMRPKKNKDPQQRLEDMFKDILFERLRLESPKYFEKVSIILGDCEQVDLGLSEEDTQILINQVNIVFHVAATVRFDEIIRKAANINVRGTRDVMRLGKKMKNLKALVYVSTAFSNCTLSHVDEIFYDTEMTGDKLLNIVDLLDDDKLEALTPTLIGKWPNTYTFTKAIAENVVRQYGQNMPVSIIRPSIVISTYKEPVAGWINNYYGATGISIGAAVGILRTLHIKPDNAADVIPADYCINATITSAWIVGQSYSDENKEIPENADFLDDIKMEDNIPIFNYVSSPQKRLSWREYMRYCEVHGLKHPSLLCMWHYCFFLNSNKYVHLFCVLFLHFIPGMIVDAGLYLTGRKPMLIKAYKKIQKGTNVLEYFTLKEWTFRNYNTQAMWKKLNNTDKRLFEFDMNLMTWNEYFFTFVRGGRVYLLKDPIETMPEAKIKYRNLKIAHYSLCTFILLIVIKIVWMIVSPFF